MSRLPDLHPADTAARHALRARLVQARRDLGWGQRELARQLGILQTSLGELERRAADCSWQVATLQRWAAPLGLRLAFDLHNLPDPDGDVRVAVLAAMPPSPERDRALLVARLRAARYLSGVSQTELGRRLGVTGRAVSLWEQGTDGVLLVAAQRWARALGGALVVDLTPVPSEAVV